jgi:hypothetical protein
MAENDVLESQITPGPKQRDEAFGGAVLASGSIPG